MSDYQTNKGVLKVVTPNEGETRLELMERLYLEMDLPIEDYDESDFCYLTDDKYFIYGETVYEFIEHEEDRDDDGTVCLMDKNEDGTISFYTRFYNGGCGLHEMLEEKMKQLEF